MPHIAYDETIVAAGAALGRTLARHHHERALAKHAADNEKEPSMVPSMALAALGGMLGPISAAGGAYLGQRRYRSREQARTGNRIAIGPSVAGALIGGTLRPRHMRAPGAAVGAYLGNYYAATQARQEALLKRLADHAGAGQKQASVGRIKSVS